MQAFFVRWIVTTIAVLAAAHIVPGIDYHGDWGALLTASLILGLINAIVKPFVLILSLPLLFLTFGLFTWVINSCFLVLVGKMVDQFDVSGWKSAFLGSLVISFVTMLIKWLQVPEKQPRITIKTSRSASSALPPSSDKVIDV
jgi:putative membrane protein